MTASIQTSRRTALGETRRALLGGLWAMAHEARTDWSMILGSLYLLIVGAGAVVARHRDRASPACREKPRATPSRLTRRHSSLQPLDP